MLSQLSQPMTCTHLTLLFCCHSSLSGPYGVASQRCCTWSGTILQNVVQDDDGNSVGGDYSAPADVVVTVQPASPAGQLRYSKCPRYATAHGACSTIWLLVQLCAGSRSRCGSVLHKRPTAVQQCHPDGGQPMQSMLARVRRGCGRWCASCAVHLPAL